MKKQYIQPSMKVYSVQPTSIIATSDFSNGGSGDPNTGRAKDFFLGLDADEWEE